ncbi:MAG: hypothetical protein CBC54_001740 [Rhizobiales bacterium TMED94]|nr:hypothetical protein [Rhodobiaceae bacterium]RPF88746.1 MAG: hypothetical protein CBC54_001740 [Rhizobiales bacterium TMED94]|tara:strand:+ start:3039 stop:3287 length:249 start_codon:yes stop_codon:yes gene_type:complete
MNLNILIDGIDADDFISSLQPKISLSTSSACSTGEIETSHVLNAIGLDDEKARISFRIGLGRFTTKDYLKVAIKIIVDKLKN